MSTKMDYRALLDFFGAFNKGIENRTKAIDQTDKALGKFRGVMTSGIQGQAAVGISNYINEVHKEGIEAQLQALITRFNELVNIYVGNYREVDEGGDAFYLSSNDYERLDANITRLTSKVIPYFSDFNKIVSSVSDICDLSSAKSKASSAHKSLTEDTNQLKKKIKNQREKWVRYESKQSKAFDELDDEISAIESLIDQYKSKSPNVMTGYQEGMFNAQMSDQTAQVLTNMYQNIESDSKKAKVAQKNISHAIKDYQKFIEAKRKKAEEEANKRDGWSSLVVDAAFILGGAVVTIASGGTAAPLILTAGSMLLDGFQIVEDFDKATSGKKYGFNFIKDSMVHLGISRENAENVYSILNIAAGAAGSDKAFKGLVKDGFMVGKVDKAAPVLKNTKNWLKRDTSKTILQATKGDFEAMGSNSKMAVSRVFSKEKYELPKVVGKSGSELHEYNHAVAMSRYGHEGIKETIKEGAKQQIIDPIMETNNDNSSISSKSAKKTAEKLNDKIVDDIIGE